MAQNTAAASPVPSTSLAPNGVVTAANPRGQVGGNRKKQKRRAKEAAKKAALDQHSHAPQTPQPDYDQHYTDSDLPDDQQEDYYSDEEDYDEEDNEQATTAAPVPASSALPRQHYTTDPASLPSTNAKRKHKKKQTTG